VDTFINTIRRLIQDGEELTITVNSDKKAQSQLPSKSEREELFYSLFGNWEGEETGDELVKQIYSGRVSGIRDIEL
jgi:hypothetical protein